MSPEEKIEAAQKLIDEARAEIADDAHEPTGAELVGKVCEYSDSGFTACMAAKSECRGIGPHGYMDSRGTWYKFARLAR